MAIVPAYNEEGRIGPTLDALQSVAGVSEICVVDDGSTDGTLNEVEMRDVTVISHQKNAGKGQAIRSGIEYFLTTKLDIAIFIDADGQHDPQDIPKFLQYYHEHSNCDVVVASRFGTEQWTYNMPFLRKISNLLSRFGIWILYNGFVVEDPQNGYRAYSRRTLEAISFDTNGYEAETEMLIDAYLKGFNFGTIHIESIYDEEGNSSKFSLLMDTWAIPGIMVKLFFKRKPFLLRSASKRISYRRRYRTPVRHVSN